MLLPILYIVGVLYGIFTFVTEMKKRHAAKKSHLGLSAAIVVCCGAAFLLTVS